MLRVIPEYAKRVRGYIPLLVTDKSIARSAKRRWTSEKPMKDTLSATRKRATINGAKVTITGKAVQNRTIDVLRMKRTEKSVAVAARRKESAYTIKTGTAETMTLKT